MTKKRKPSVSLHLPESSAPRHQAVMIRADDTVETVDVGEEIVISYQELLGSYNRNNGTWFHRPHIKMTTGKPIVRALRYTTISSDLIIAT